MKQEAVRRAAWVALAAAWLAWPAHAQDPAHVRSLAATCANCHGTDGRSVGGLPGLAGQDAKYTYQQLLEFKNGKRPATIMHQLTKGYSDEQLQAIANYFAAQSRTLPAGGR